MTPGTRTSAAILGAAGTLPLVVAWWAQYVAGLAPCELCLWERWPYRILILLSLFALILPGRVARTLPLAGIAVGTWAAAVAGLHVGVERGWWPSPLAACAAPSFHGGTIAERLASMPLRPSKPCDAADMLFRWLPTSMATLDFLYALLLVALAAALAHPRFARQILATRP